MISIIVSTYREQLLEELSANIKHTIGVEYEIIPINNQGVYSICQAYNIGAGKAKYPYLCFVHEDVLIQTNNWGIELVNIMESDDKVGLVGIAGSKFKSTYPTTGWGTGPFVKTLWRGRYKTLDQFNNIVEVDLDKSEIKKEIEEVLIVDGVFLFTKKKVFEKCEFDEKSLVNFHGYDTDFSLQVFFNSYKIFVARNIEILHYSKGVQDKEFAKSNRIIMKKWKSLLPASSSDLKLSSYKQNYFNLLVWAGYIWFALQRKLKIK